MPALPSFWFASSLRFEADLVRELTGPISRANWKSLEAARASRPRVRPAMGELLCSAMGTVGDAGIGISSSYTSKSEGDGVPEYVLGVLGVTGIIGDELPGPMINVESGDSSSGRLPSMCSSCRFSSSMCST